MKLDVLQGQKEKDQYQNLQFYTAGGMGEIYRAKDIVTGDDVAIKLIRIVDLEYKALLENEFKIASALIHENILRSDYHAECSDSTGDYFYSVSEFCSEGSLRKRISTYNQFFSIEDCLNYFYDLLKGLQEAHKIIIHRDLKPENILISKTGSLKICDFGIARYVNELTRTKTLKGSGTFPYMAPECWLMDKNTIQMDIYSLGIIFFEIITLQLPFNGQTEAEYREHHFHSSLPDLTTIRNDLPITISEIIRKMTMKNPRERFNNVSEILQALDRIVETSKSNAPNINAIIKNINRKISSIEEAKMKEQKRLQEFAEKQKELNYSISLLFKQISVIAETINSSLIDEKISYTPFLIPTNATASTYRLSFMGKTMTISFYHHETISSYLKSYKEMQIDLQYRKYGIVMQQPPIESIELDNGYFLGKAEINYGSRENNFGFNILLRKLFPEDIQGEWWVCKFSHSFSFSNSTNEFYFAFEPPDFFEKYEFGRRNVMSNNQMRFNKIDDSDIIDLIEKMTH